MDLLDLFVKIKADTNGLDAGLNESEQKSKGFASKMGKAFTSMGALAVKGAAVAGGALTTLAGLSLNSYANYEQLVGGVEKLYGEASGTVLQYAQNAYKTVGMSANKYMETATQFSSALVANLGGDVNAAAEKTDLAMQVISDNVNVFGSNMEEVSNAVKGFSKQNYTMLDNLKLGYGGTQEEAKRLVADAAKLTDAQKELGVTVDANSLSFDNLVNAVAVVQQNMGIMGATSKEAATTIEGSKNMMLSAWANLITGFGDESANLGQLVQNAIDSAVTFAGNALPRFAIIFEAIFKALKEAAPRVIKAAEKMLGDILEKVVDNAPKMLKKGYALVLKLAQAISDKMPTVIAKMGVLLGKLLKQIIAHAPQILGAAVKLIGTLAQGIIKSIPSVVSAMASMGKQMLQGLWQGITSLTDWIWGQISGFFNNTIVGGIKKLLGIHSPSKVFAQIGDYCVKGLEQGMQPISDGSTIKNALKGAKGTIDVKTSVSGTNTLDQLQNALKIDTESRNYNINLITTLDGKTIASSTVKYTQAELNKRERRANRLQGVRA